MRTVCDSRGETKLEIGAVSLGKITLSNAGSTVGIVKNSRLDRVGNVNGSGESSSSSSLNIHEGTGYGSSSSSSTFSVVTEIDTRHEFWVDDNGCETQFVFPVNIPVADGQRLAVTQLLLEGAELESRVLAFVFDNQSSRKKFIYIVESNSLTELTGAQHLFQPLRDILFTEAYGEYDDFLEAHPAVKAEWAEKSVEVAPNATFVAIKLFLWCFRFGIPLFCFLWAWDLGFKNIFIATIGGLFVGHFAFKFLVWIISFTPFGARFLENHLRKATLVSEHYDKMLDATFSKLVRA